jgi:uncharacterized membrane protein YfcA
MDWIILIAAAFAAGVLNTIAAGGTFLIFPALVFAGLPPVAANATSAVAVLPGYLSGTIGFARELRTIKRALILRLTFWTLIGGLVGAGLLMVSSNAAFSAIVPFLLLAATLIFVFAAPLRTWASNNARTVTPYGAIGLIIVSVFWGLFQWRVGHCLACSVFHVGHEQHSPNERFEKLVIFCALCHFGSGLCPWRVCPLA